VGGLSADEIRGLVDRLHRVSTASSTDLLRVRGIARVRFASARLARELTFVFAVAASSSRFVIFF